MIDAVRVRPVVRDGSAGCWPKPAIPTTPAMRPATNSRRTPHHQSDILARVRRRRRRTRAEMSASCRNARLVAPATGRGVVGLAPTCRPRAEMPDSWRRRPGAASSDSPRHAGLAQKCPTRGAGDRARRRRTDLDAEPNRSRAGTEPISARRGVGRRARDRARPRHRGRPVSPGPADPCAGPR